MKAKLMSGVYAGILPCPLALVILTLLTLSCEERPRQHDSEPYSAIISTDLSNSRVSAIAEGAQGYIWIGTFRGLNRYNVHEYHQYFSTPDSMSLRDNQINDVFKDSKGRLWIATVNGVCAYTSKDNFVHIPINYMNQNGYQFVENKDGKIFLNMNHQMALFNEETMSFDVPLPDFDLNYTYCQRCFIDNSNKLWVANPLLLRRFNSNTLEVEDSVAVQGAPTHFFIQGERFIWMSGNGSISLYDTHSRKYVPVPAAIRSHPVLSKATVNYIHPYGTNGLLFCTMKNGIFLYSSYDGSVVHQSEQGFPFKAPNFRVNTMFTDSQKNIWMGSTDQGIAVIYNYKERFNPDNSLSMAFAGKTVTSLAMAEETDMWVATLTGELYVRNLREGKSTEIPLQRLLGSSYNEKSAIKDILVDDEGYVWLAAQSDHKVLKCRYSNGTATVVQSYDMPAPMTISQDNTGTIWVGGMWASQYVLHAKRRTDSSFTHIEAFTFPATFLSSVVQVDDSHVWAACFMEPIMQIDTRSWEVSRAPISEEDFDACIQKSVFIPTQMTRDSQGDIWIGTVANGLWRWTRSDQRLSRMEGLDCEDVSSILEDEQGNIWVGTLYGLSKYDRTVGKFTTYHKSDGLGGDEFYDSACCLQPSGFPTFGGSHGITAFNPVDVSVRRNVPLWFEDLKIHNRSARPSEGKNIDNLLSLCSEIRLGYADNGFSISFAALDYNEFDRIRYSYKMEGFDSYWIEAGSTREAYYTKLPPGKYTFRVRISDNDKSINETENSIAVIVARPPWGRWWAKCIYLLAAAGLLMIVLNVRRGIMDARQAAAQSEREKEQERRTNKMNASYFANISHEFRTPLTMISGPVTQLCKDTGITGENKNLLHIVQRNVVRMLSLVNQLMDFNKLENDTLRLQVKRADIVSLLSSIAEVFTVHSKEKGIDFVLRGLEDSLLTWIDADKISKITNNLLSNAFKFTKTGGKVELCLDIVTREDAALKFSLTDKDVDREYVEVIVADTGKGVPEDKLEKIFERFYQLEGDTKGSYNYGTGIGLYFAKSLVELHHGHIKAANRSEGTGTVFTFILPMHEASYSEKERQPLEETDQTKRFPLNITDEYDVAEETTEEEKRKLLVVDDDTEVVHYLKSLLSPHYKVTCRFDAESAMKAIMDEQPEIVLSDVVMPDKDGYELCRHIKDDSNLCHIPIVLLTAKTAVDNQVRGLESGADAYVTKPFDPTYLLALVKSILANRDKLRSMLGSTTKPEKIESDGLSAQDRLFMTNLYNIMEQELSNSELDITKITEMLRISRTKFYYKMKGLTGENPSAFFKRYKLNRAKEFMMEGKYNVSEIADMTGFSTLSHFSTSFKKQFGVSPSEYRR